VKSSNKDYNLFIGLKSWKALINLISILIYSNSNKLFNLASFNFIQKFNFISKFNFNLNLIFSFIFLQIIHNFLFIHHLLQLKRLSLLRILFIKFDQNFRIFFDFNFKFIFKYYLFILLIKIATNPFYYFIINYQFNLNFIIV
jgi:hypothetical protein